MPWQRATSRITDASWGAVRCLTLGSQLDAATHPEGTMPEYKFVLYETLDEGRIARIMLNRPEARNAQNRGMLVELNDAFLRAEADDEVRVVILGGSGADVLVGPRHGVEGLARGVHPRPQPAPDPGDQRRHPQGRREPDAAGVALLLREHPPLAQPAQDHDRPGPRRRLRRRAHAALGVRPHRRRRRHPVHRRRGHPPRDVRRRVLRPPVGVRPPQGQGAAAHRRHDRRATRPTPSAW